MSRCIIQSRCCNVQAARVWADGLGSCARCLKRNNPRTKLHTILATASIQHCDRVGAWCVGPTMGRVCRVLDNHVVEVIRAALPLESHLAAVLHAPSCRRMLRCHTDDTPKTQRHITMCKVRSAVPDSNTTRPATHNTHSSARRHAMPNLMRWPSA